MPPMRQQQLPLIVIVGQTGTGKSDLAIHLAKRFHAQVVNADAMQLYRGLPIATNQMPLAQRQSIAHHLFATLDVDNTHYNVCSYRNAALSIIRRLHDSGTLAIVAGGTAYYVEALLWRVLLDIPDPAADNDDASRQLDTAQLYQRLCEVDSEQAHRLHPQDRRKILRSLQVFEQSGGLKHSEMLRQQREQEGGSSLGGPLRYRRSLVLWTSAPDRSWLDRRLVERVDEMLERGLIEEMREFRARVGSSVDYTRGIFQAIGFKEFDRFLASGDEADFQAGLVEMKARTLRYARRQEKWIRKRLVERSDRELPNVVQLDVSDWPEALRRAEQAVELAITSASSDDISSAPLERNRRRRPTVRNIVCTLCNRTLQGEEQYRAHVAARPHREMRKRRAKASSEKIASTEANKSSACDDHHHRRSHSSSHRADERVRDGE